MTLDNVLKTHFLNLYHIALSDTEVDTEELVMLYQIGEEKGISREEIDMIVLNPDTIKFSTPQGIIEKIESLYNLARIAWANGNVDEGERRVMAMFCAKYGFENENIPIIVQFLLDEAEKNTPKEHIFKIVSENL